jgi:hypothetical protein
MVNSIYSNWPVIIFIEVYNLINNLKYFILKKSHLILLNPIGSHIIL